MDWFQIKFTQKACPSDCCFYACIFLLALPLGFSESTLEKTKKPLNSRKNNNEEQQQKKSIINKFRLLTNTPTKFRAI